MRNAMAVVLAGAVCASCASTGPNTKKGGAIGAGAGAVVGGIIGLRRAPPRAAPSSAPRSAAPPARSSAATWTSARKIARELPRAGLARGRIAVTFESGILFPFDSSELLPGAPQPAHAGGQLRTRRARVIVGHTDSQGTDAYNQDRPTPRALGASYLAAQGVSRSASSPPAAAT
jgi:outer membrane protein OmpA-like peptidoglycan-associated protein